MKNQNKNIETLGAANVETAKTKKQRQPRQTKKVAEVVETVETVEATKTKKQNAIQKSIAMLQKVSGVDQKSVQLFLVRHFANQSSKVKISAHITKLVLKVAAGNLEIPQVDKTTSFEMFTQTMIDKFGVDKTTFENFIINLLASKKKVNLDSFFKDVFFKASTNPEFLLKINDFKRF